MNHSTNSSMKKFHLVSKYANYPTWDEKQNAPLFQNYLVISIIFYKNLSTKLLRRKIYNLLLDNVNFWIYFNKLIDNEL